MDTLTDVELAISVPGLASTTVCCDVQYSFDAGLPVIERVMIGDIDVTPIIEKRPELLAALEKQLDENCLPAEQDELDEAA